MTKEKQTVLIIILQVFLLVSCIEAFEPDRVNFETALVIEATITDETKNQEVKISRTFAIDTMGIYGERGAIVQVLASEGGVIYEFEEQEEGLYFSKLPFAAKPGIGYSLSILTENGRRYISEQAVTPPPTKIDNLYAERGINNANAAEGIFIYLDSSDPNGLNTNYRFEYEETYKIIAPFWSPADAYVIAPFPNPVFGTRPRTQEERICFNTLLSKNIIQESTINFNENRITKFPVRFINRNDYILTNRYSILVRQYVQSYKAFIFYKTLASLSSSNSIFSQIQTGFLEGNIMSQEENSSEKVIGFFETSSVSEKRIFFNYEDFFPGEQLPDYIVDCQLLNIPTLAGIPIPSNSPLQDAIENGSFKFYNDNKNENGNTDLGAPFVMVTSPCGDCTILGSNIVPDFWVE